MLLIAKIGQIIFGLLSIIFALNSLAAQSGNEAIGALGFAVALVIAVYLLQKYIAKNSTAIELKNYRLRIFQTL
jgi:hypothetical protein